MKMRISKIKMRQIPCAWGGGIRKLAGGAPPWGFRPAGSPNHRPSPENPGEGILQGVSLGPGQVSLPQRCELTPGGPADAKIRPLEKEKGLHE